MTAMPLGWDAAERAAGNSYGRLLAWLAFRWRDVAAAEDALSAAFVAALTHWPRDGVPDSPDAWLLTAARRELMQRDRHLRLAQSPAVQAMFDEEPSAPERLLIPDRRLALMFVCAHPALPASLHAPLMLQTLLGLDARAIASACLVSPTAMAQRLVRAKAKIRDAGIRFDEPEARDLPLRLAAVLDAIYGAYGIGSNIAALGAGTHPPAAMSTLAQEALYLARLAAGLMPEHSEALALAALLLYCEARRLAQFDAGGRFMPLAEQDTALWDGEAIAEAEALLARAARLSQPGSFQVEAAIQSAHCQRAFSGTTPWPAIAELYRELVAQHPAIGARVGHAVAVGESDSAEAGLALLQALAPEEVRDYQPYWVALAHLRRRAGQPAAARQAFERALGLTVDPRVRRHLLQQLMATQTNGGDGSTPVGG